MHEMAIVQSVLEIALAEAGKHSATKINGVKLRIGEMSGVVRESVEFAFEVLTKGTPAENALLEIETVPLRMSCRTCGHSTNGEAGPALICGRCGEAMRIISGREMKVEYIDLD